MAVIYKAHEKKETEEIQTVKEHSKNTADLCKQFAIPVFKDLMYVVGMLHDCGKYQTSFQRRIDGEHIRVEHATCGALLVKEYYQNPAALMMEYCIVGHHSGIPDGGCKKDSPDLPTLGGRLNRKTEDFSAYKEEISMADLPEIDPEEFLNLLLQDCGKNREMIVDKFAFFTRYAFSCLVDADTIDTIEFCKGERTRPLKADFAVCLRKVNEKLDSFVCTTPLQKARAGLQKQAFCKVNIEGEIFLMNMPTGSGKTLASVKWALERAIRAGRKRIIYVIPYNSIIEQTVSVFEDVFGDDAEILRHQSTFSYEDENGESEKDETDDAEAYRKVAKSATENWDVSSIIVTTSVQFFESLYANKRGKLRKMHNMADSILIFDEAHLMPQEYLQPCLRAVSYLTKYLNSEAVFLTATMPDFSALFRQYALPNSQVINLIDDTSDFPIFQKCKYHLLREQSAEGILEKAMNAPSVLIVVNAKETARKLYQKCSGKKYHLSTYMTAYDREEKIREICLELERLGKEFSNYEDIPQERKITVISTSLIEAGVDLDFYTVFRELAGLDSILQAGGRCNREGKRERADVFVFEFGDENRKMQDIRSNITSDILKNMRIFRVRRAFVNTTTDCFMRKRV